MSVPKGKRKESQFEVIKNFYKLRKEEYYAQNHT